MSNTKDTLVILTPGFAADEADTTCLPFLQGHILATKNKYPDLEMIILAFQYPYIKGTYSWKGIEVISFDGRERGKANRLYIWWQVWQTLKKLNKSKKIVGLFSLWCTESALIGSYFAKMYRLRHRNWLCGQDAKAGNKYVRLTHPAPNELVAMSDFLQREFNKNYDILPAHVIPLGVDPANFSEGQSVRTIDVLGAGSLIPLKQYDVFVNVINELRHHLPYISSMICGKGVEKEKLNGQIRTLGLTDNVILAGEMPHNKVLGLMQQAKIFLHTSNYEGFGTVCLEALYAGAHVVSFTKPMDREIAHWHHVSNEEEMIATVKKLLQDPATQYEKVCPYYSDDIACSMMALYS